MTKRKKIESTIENWEEGGSLGNNEASARLSDLTIDEMESSLGLKSISIRMQEDLLVSLKAIAKYRGLGYQPLMKQILQRFVDAEMKRIALDYLAENSKREAKDQDEPEEEPPRDCA